MVFNDLYYITTNLMFELGILVTNNSSFLMHHELLTFVSRITDSKDVDFTFNYSRRPLDYKRLKFCIVVCDYQ